ncbi:MAG: hypothetical protein AAFO75_13180, partial [Pseudomonadota bacterium]
SIALSAASGALIFLLVPAGYILTALLFGLYISAKNQCPCSAAAGPAAIVMHMSWATGFLRRCATHIGAIGLGRHAARQPGSIVDGTLTAADTPQAKPASAKAWHTS